LNRFASLVFAITAALAFLPAGNRAAGQDRGPYPVLQFRFVNPEETAPVLETPGALRLLADEDFPPFSFRGGDGLLEGISIDAAIEACRELGKPCEIVAKPWDALLPAFEKGEGDAIVAGPKLDAELAARYLFTRPYFRSMARFAVRTETPLDKADIRTLAGKRIAVARGSAHAAWIKMNFPQSAPVEFDGDMAALEALRTGAVDAAFGDSLKLLFWSRGTASRGCCQMLPGAFSDETLLSPAMGIVVRPGREDLMRAFDYGLDRVQLTGAFAAIFRRYVPASPW
jgi:polar amino acid transport system substrate-binding protein